MQGRSGTRAGLVYLLAGAALGAAVVLVVWIGSGGRPFGEVVGTADVSPPTPAPVQPTEVQRRTDAPATGRAKLEKAPPSLGGSAELRFRKPAAERRAKARRAAAAAAERRTRRAPARRKPAVRVVAPPSEVPVAVVPSATPTAAPAPPPPAPSGGAGEPAKRRPPALSVGAGEG